MRRNKRSNHQSYNRAYNKNESTVNMLQVESEEAAVSKNDMAENTNPDTKDEVPIKTKKETKVSNTKKSKSKKVEVSEQKTQVKEPEDNQLKIQKVDTIKMNEEQLYFHSDRDIILLKNESYEILANELPYIFHPEIYGIKPVWSNDPEFQYKCILELKDNQLYLNSFQVTSDRGYPMIGHVKPEICNIHNGLETVQYMNINEPLKYTGAVMIANSFVKDYKTEQADLGNPPCFSYKFVGELIFEQGKLITTANHNKAMRRIRKNIDLGLRSLDKKRDVKCIKNFIKASFIGDYKEQRKKNSWKHYFKLKSKSN